MFCIIYEFQVNTNSEPDFIKNWKGLTDLIYKYENSLGSRLHRIEDGQFLAYAQWPDRNTWENSGSKLPLAANAFRDGMRAACSNIKTSFELDVEEDLIKDRPYWP